MSQPGFESRTFRIRYKSVTAKQTVGYLPLDVIQEPAQCHNSEELIFEKAMLCLQEVGRSWYSSKCSNTLSGINVVSFML
jgi:hypothetical protein